MPVTRTLLTSVVCCAFVDAAIANDPPPHPCESDGYKEFDFWLGRWEAYDSRDGSLQGLEHITKDYDSCVLTQHWEQQSDRYKHPASENRMRGTSVTARSASAQTGPWWQTWVDNVGNFIVLSGGMKDGVMVLNGVEANTPATVRREWHWQPLPDGSVRSWGTFTTDAGATWQTGWDITYKRPREMSQQHADED